MHNTSSNFSISYFRRRILACLVLIIFLFSFVPSVSLAQQPTAIINTLSGMVLVNGQEQGKGTALSAGDIIETQTGAHVVLEFSDGSLLELGENTKLDIAELSQTATGARVSRVKMAWGWIRAKLSSDHQKEGSKFDIETPNALVGVKFSQPDVEVSYDPASQETVALALTVALAAKNLITDEEKMIPIGSMAIITALGIKIIAGAAATGVIAAEATGAGAAGAEAGAGGISTKTMVIGAGALAAVGGAAAVAASSGGGGDGNGGSSASFAGNFRYQDNEWTKSLNLTQNGNSISGTYSFIYSDPAFPSCREDHVGQVNGTARGNSATLNFVGTSTWSCDDGYSEPPVQDNFTESCTLGDNNILTCEGYDFALQ
jgi:hypothetical protein